MPARSSSPPAASAATTSWCASSWPTERLGPAPKKMVAGVPHHVDGRMIAIAQDAGAAVINADRMWHYTEGVTNWAPIWPNHGIRILPGPSSMWFDAKGERLEAPCLPGFDTLGTLRRILSTGHEHSWFVLTQAIIKKEFALSGSEQNPDMTSKSWLAVLKSRRGAGAPPPVEAFKQKGEDFIVRDNLRDLVAGMNELAGEAAARPRPPAAADRGARPRDRQSVLQGRAGHSHPRRAQLSRRSAGPHRQAAQDPRSGQRPADCRAAQHPDAQDARRAAHQSRRRGARRSRRSRSPASMRPAKSPASAAAAITATTRSKARSSAAASFPAGMRDGTRQAIEPRGRQ